MTRNDARFSTYSGAPSLQPSIAPTLDTTSNRSSTQRYSTRFSEQNFLAPQTIPENSRSIYGSANTAAVASTTTLSSTDPKTADLKAFAKVYDRMSDVRADKQRFVMSSNKTEEVSKIALGAKVERALSRRMVGQDAVFTPKSNPSKPLDEKRALEAIEAN